MLDVRYTHEPTRGSRSKPPFWLMIITLVIMLAFTGWLVERGFGLDAAVTAVVTLLLAAAGVFIWRRPPAGPAGVSSAAQPEAEAAPVGDEVIP